MEGVWLGLCGIFERIYGEECIMVCAGEFDVGRFWGRGQCVMVMDVCFWMLCLEGVVHVSVRLVTGLVWLLQTKVAVLGAAGGIGQPLSLLMKMNPLVKELSLYDVVNTPGVGADLSHINTAAKITAHMGQEQLADALKGCDLVIIPAGNERDLVFNCFSGGNHQFQTHTYWQSRSASTGFCIQLLVHSSDG